MKLRSLAGVSSRELLNPWALAPKVGLTVVPMDDFISTLPEEVAHHLLNGGGSAWSGGVLPIPLPDGSRLCILNSKHSEHRRKITLMEEISHVHLKHQPTKLVSEGSGVRARDFDTRQEQDAYGIGAAALLPWAAFFSAINDGMSVPELSAHYGVSTQLIEYRIKICGASRLFDARQRA